MPYLEIVRPATDAKPYVSLSKQANGAMELAVSRHDGGQQLFQIALLALLVGLGKQCPTHETEEYKEPRQLT